MQNFPIDLNINTSILFDYCIPFVPMVVRMLGSIKSLIMPCIHWNSVNRYVKLLPASRAYLAPCEVAWSSLQLHVLFDYLWICIGLIRLNIDV